MISTGQIIAAGAITGLGVAVAAAAARWPAIRASTSAAGTIALMIAWRALSNRLNLNGDFVPAISAADAGCLLVGALAPALVATTLNVPPRRRWLPAVVGGIAGFAVNVVVL